MLHCRVLRPPASSHSVETLMQACWAACNKTRARPLDHVAPLNLRFVRPYLGARGVLLGLERVLVLLNCVLAVKQLRQALDVEELEVLRTHTGRRLQKLVILKSRPQACSCTRRHTMYLTPSQYLLPSCETQKEANNNYTCGMYYWLQLAFTRRASQPTDL